MDTLECRIRDPLNILALETSSPWCSVALWLNGRVLAREEHAGQRHSELLLPMVHSLLAEASIELPALHAIAFGAGPGSFTGLRIACGVAQGLAAGAGLTTAGVVTLAAIAEASAGQRVLACLDARMGEIYYAAYERAGAEWNVIHPPQLCTPERAPAVHGADWVAAGNGFAAHGPALARRYDGQIAQTRSELHPHAREIAILGAGLAQRGSTVAPEQAHPLYLRDHVALTVEERRARSRAPTEQDSR
jgi:tRNA threonylcarbamoyladenosine biosynthesis protein TsaB